VPEPHSLALLGRIDVLQIHKATADVLRNDGIQEALEFARTAGIRSFGASVSDIEAAEATRDAGFYNYVQFPFNKLSIALGPIFGIASHSDMHVLVNRPFATGCILGVPDDERQNTMRNALSFIRNQQFAGAILVGTKSVMHLSENVSVFNAMSSAHELGNSSA
jgi:aryl-alcohol dehydrogenase-like predicted oxidoreductase